MARDPLDVTSPLVRLLRLLDVRAHRATAVILSVGVVIATASPLRHRPDRDSFPLSPYAMFAFARPTRLTMDYAQGLTATGARRTLTPWIVGSGEVLQALNVIARARSSKTLPALCTTIAGRVAELDAYRDVTSIQIVSGTHDAVEFLVRDVRGTETERTRCAVPR